LHPDPDHMIIAKAKVYPHYGHELPEVEHSLQVVYDTLVLPPVTLVVTRVEQYGRCCTDGRQLYVAPVPVGMEPCTPFETSGQSLAPYLRYTNAISGEHLSALFARVFGLDIREGGLANVFQPVKGQLVQRAAEILTQLRSRRLIGGDVTSACVHGRQQWDWVAQNIERGLHPGDLTQSRSGLDVRGSGDASVDNLGVRTERCSREALRRATAGRGVPSSSGGSGPRSRRSRVYPRLKMSLRRPFSIHKHHDTLAISTLYQCQCNCRRRVTHCVAP
jgi:hypothetical protein